MKMKYVAAAAVAVAGTVASADEEANAQEPIAASEEAIAVETVNDGGVEAVREADAAAPTEPPKKVENAESEVKAWLKEKKWRPGWDAAKKRFIRVEMAQFDCEDPAKVQNVMVQRDMAAKRAVLQAKTEIIEFVKTELDAADIVEMMGAEAPGVSPEAKDELVARVQKLKQSSSAEFRAEMPLFGATCVRQTESWNRGKYQIAIAMVWSPALERSARAVLTGEKVVCKPKPNGKSIEDWLESINPAFMSGPIQHVDANGTRWFLGVSAGAADEDLDAMTMRTNRRIADLSAKQMLAFSLWGDVKACEAMRQELTATTFKGKTTAEVAQWLETKVSQSIKSLPVRGMSQLLSEEVEHPVTGGRIYVSVYGINQDAATGALKVEAANFATRAELERAKTVERGRAAANKALVDGAKNDPRDFKRGKDAQNAALGAEAAKRKGKQNVQEREAAQKREKQAQAGVFNSGADVDDDDI